MSSTHSHLQTYLRCLMHTDTELPPWLTTISVDFTAQVTRACCQGLISIPGSHSHALISIPGSRSHASTSIPGYIVSGLLRGYTSPALTHQSKSNRRHLLSAEAVFQRADGEREQSLGMYASYSCQYDCSVAARTTSAKTLGKFFLSRTKKGVWSSVQR